MRIDAISFALACINVYTTALQWGMTIIMIQHQNKMGRNAHNTGRVVAISVDIDYISGLAAEERFNSAGAGECKSGCQVI